MTEPAPKLHGRHIVAVTSCPTGIAHTFMSAEALAKVARLRGHTIDVEKQGAAGVRDRLSDESIARADVVVIAADTAVDRARFAGKPIHETSTGVAIKNTDAVLDAALARIPSPTDAPPTVDAAPAPVHAAETRFADTGAIAGPYRHLLTGVSFAVPFAVAGGLLMALAQTIGPEAAGLPGALARSLALIGDGVAFRLIVPALAGYMAYSIADRPGLAPGMIGGLIAQDLGTGFVGGIAAGFLAGYLVRWLDAALRIPARLDALKPVLILPLIATAVVGLAMIHGIAPWARTILDALVAAVSTLADAPRLAFGAALGAMVAFDLGGPVNKAAYAFAVGLLATDVFGPMAAVMAAGVAAPLGLALAVALRPRSFGAYERAAARSSALLGAAFVTEGAIPLAARDPSRVLPAAMAGGAVAAALSLVWGCTLKAPLGGLFVLLIPNAIRGPLHFLLAVAVGTVVTAAVFLALRTLAHRT